MGGNKSKLNKPSHSSSEKANSGCTQQHNCACCGQGLDPNLRHIMQQPVNPGYAWAQNSFSPVVPAYQASSNPPYSSQMQNVAHVQRAYEARESMDGAFTSLVNNKQPYLPSAPPLTVQNETNIRKDIKKASEFNAPVVEKLSMNNLPEETSMMAMRFNKHMKFLRHLLISGDVKNRSRKHFLMGFYCEACMVFYIHGAKHHRETHEDGELHKKKNMSDMVYRFCSVCRVDLLCSDFLWNRHLQTDIHKFWKTSSQTHHGKPQVLPAELREKESYLIVSGFPKGMRWRPIQNFFSDFAWVTKVEVAKEHDTEYARVFFLKRRSAWNIHQSGFPLILEDRVLKTRVDWRAREEKEK